MINLLTIYLIPSRKNVAELRHRLSHGFSWHGQNLSQLKHFSVSSSCLGEGFVGVSQSVTVCHGMRIN